MPIRAAGRPAFGRRAWRLPQQHGWGVLLLLAAVLLVMGCGTVAVAGVRQPPANLADGGLGAWLASGAVREGDVVELPCGRRWRGVALTIPADLGPLTIRAQAGCSADARPQLIGHAPLPGAWRHEGQGVYSIEAASPVARVLAGGQVLPMVRFPVGKPMALAEPLQLVGAGTTGNRQGLIRIGPLPTLSGGDLTDAWVHVRSTGYWIDEGRVTGLAEGQLQVAGDINAAPRGALWSLSGKAWMLRQPGAHGWAWEPAQRRLYLRLTTGADPAGAGIEAAPRLPVITANRTAGVRLSGFAITGAGLDGVQCEGCKDLGVEDLVIQQSQRDGLYLEHVRLATVVRSTITQAGRDAITARFARDVTVNDSVIQDTGTAGWPQSSRAAINGHYSHSLVVERNRISRSGYIGIRFHRESFVRHNLVLDSCLALDDCGAIYTWNDNDPDALNSVVDRNVVRGVPGGHEGSPDPWTLAAGIYIDDRSINVTVSRNTVLQAERGIFLHNATRAKVHGNVVAQVQSAALSIDYGHARVPSDQFARNRIEHNLWVMEAPKLGPVFVMDRAQRTVQDILGPNTLVMRDAAPWLRTQTLQPGLLNRFPEPVPFEEAAPQTVLQGRVQVFEPGERAQSHPCPASDARECANARDETGKPVAWPLQQPAWTPRWVLWPAARRP